MVKYYLQLTPNKAASIPPKIPKKKMIEIDTNNNIKEFQGPTPLV